MKNEPLENRSFVSLVIPAYNEEKRIVNSLAKILKFMDEKPFVFEIVIVDDGSKDRTVEVARECLDGRDQVLLLSSGLNKGKGYAVKQGMLNANGKYVVFMDADLSTPIEEIDKFIMELEEGYDVVIGTRKMTGASIKKRQPLYRELLGKGFTLLSNIFLVNNVTDFTCGFKGFKNEVGRDIFKRQLIYNWSFDAEILFLGQKLGYSIKEVPVTWFDSEGTKVKLWRDIIGSLCGILKIRINNMMGKYESGNKNQGTGKGLKQ